MWYAEHKVISLRRKRANSSELTQDEQDLLTLSDSMALRHFEDLHFQRSIGSLDDETWEANLSGIKRRASDPYFIEATDRANISPSFRRLLEELSMQSEPGNSEMPGLP